MISFTDQLGRTVLLPSTPKRIVSLVPSQTEFLYELGLEEKVIGITKFCIHPTEWFRSKIRIGGTKNINLDKIASLQPDLVIANKEENVQEQVETLAKDFPVWVSDVNNLPEALEMMHAIGRITGREEKAEALIKQIETSFSNHLLPTINHKPKTAYLIWKNPYMTVGGDTFIHDMLQRAGFENIFATASRYPQVTVAQLQVANCQLLLLSSEPYPFKQADIDELQSQLPQTRIELVDGEMFSWYGSRLLHSAEYFASLGNKFA